MPVFRVDPQDVRPGRVRFSPQEAKHLRATRHKPGDVVRVSDGLSTEYEVVLTEVTHRGAAGTIRSKVHAAQERIVIHLGQAIPKGEKLDWVVEKAVELGVGVIHPLLAERSVPRLEERRAADRLERWRRVAEAARKQCGRIGEMEVRPIASLATFLDSTREADFKVVLDEGSPTGLREVLAAAGEPAAVALLVGPEGGFSKAEIQVAEEAGFRRAGLGPRILRTETAPIAALSILGFVLGDLGGPSGELSS